ncbi:hypothetical protein [Thalassolituus sp.]|jgi:hypothetical protein|uniref:hypothetical protein n=1 Tax=Thalassolituus sp. TaxID=2030822 RepID=UPI0024387777|nr:hypothetical protein [Thalassolituus sp.]
MRFSLVPALLLLLNLSLPASALPAIDGAKNSGTADARSTFLVVENLAEALLNACDSGVDDDEKSLFSSHTLSGVILSSLGVPYAVSAAVPSVVRYSSIRAPPSL